jgi:hypothetical protein
MNLGVREIRRKRPDVAPLLLNGRFTLDSDVPLATARDAVPMLTKLLSRLVQPAAPGHDYDHLFTPFAPNGASAHVLGMLFHQYANAPPDEPPPPQHKHYRAFVLELIHLNGGQRPRMEWLNAAYITCFERDDAFQVLLKVWRNERSFCARLQDVRHDVIEDLVAANRAELKRRDHYSRWRECIATPLDIEGDTLTALLKQMAPDDWHPIALGWDWNDGVAELEWITAQRTCDRATALYILCAGWPGDIATGKPRPYAAFIRDVAARLEGGFYLKAEFNLDLSVRKRLAFEDQLRIARATAESPWHIPSELLFHEGIRTPAPKYAVTNGQAHYHYEYWFDRMAPLTR